MGRRRNAVYKKGVCGRWQQNTIVGDMYTVSFLSVEKKGGEERGV